MSQSVLDAPLNLADGSPAGEVEDLVLGADGTVRAFVVTTGPELGAQTRRIALPADRVTFTASAADGARTAAYSGTAAELVDAPALQDGPARAATTAADIGTTVEPTGAPASDTVAEPPMPAAEDETAAAPSFIDSLEPETFLASDLIEEQVHTGAEADSQEIGTIDALVISDAGTVDAIIVGVGGFLGIGEKSVGVPFDAVSLSELDPGQTHIALAVTRGDLDGAPAFGTAGSPPVATEPGSANGDATQTEGRVVPAETPGPSGGNAASTTDLSTQSLLGKAVTGPDGERIGEVGEVVLDPSGAIDAVVVDVGGFLGIGEKPVAVALENIIIAGDVVSTSFTRTELESAPTYGAAAEGTAQDDSALPAQ